jgi:NADPH2:quinone reductase
MDSTDVPELMKAIEITETGGPEKLEYVEHSIPIRGEDECLVDVHVAGVNFIDIYYRNGIYPHVLPFTPGVEGIGVLREKSSAAPSDLSVGMRVGWVMSEGAYAEVASIQNQVLIPIPDGIEEAVATALLLQGMTAHYLAVDSYHIKPGDLAVVHAGAGGVGLLLTQYIKSLGGVVIATASTDEKRHLCLSAGADLAVEYSGFKEHVMEFSKNVGANVVYDGVGKDTFNESLSSVRPRGTLVVYGYSSGVVPPFDIRRLTAGSIFLTRPTLGHFIPNREELLKRANAVFTAHINGRMDARIGGRYALQDASRAQQDLESRATTGKLVLEI